MSATLRRRRAAIFLAALPAPFLPHLAFALNTTETWIGPSGSLNKSGNWSTAANWSPAAVPGSGDTVIFSYATSLNSVISYDYTGAAVTLASLKFDNTSTGINASSTLFNMSANALSTSSLIVGDTRRATVNQSGGTFAVTSSLVLGNAAGSVGAFNLTGGSLTAFPIAYLGNAGIASFNQSGGFFGANTLNLASQATSAATYNLSGGSLSASIFSLAGTLGSTCTLTLSAGSINTGSFAYIGDHGSAVVNQTGGTNGAKYLYIASASGSSATYNLSGGLLNYADAGDYGTSGSATINHSGGTITHQNSFFAFDLAHNAGSSCTYNLSNAGIINANGTLIVGNAGTATFNLSGGLCSLNNTTNSYSLGTASTGLGTFNLTGGSLTIASNGIIADSGSATFNHSAAVHALAAGCSLTIANAQGSTGVYNLSAAATLSAPGSLVVGNNGRAVFNQTDGSVSVGSLLLAAGSGTGLYTLTGNAVLTAGTEFLGLSSVASVNQFSGTHVITGTGLHIGSSFGGYGNFLLAGGSLLSTSGEEVGGNGFAFFRQTGGTNTLAGALPLTIGALSGASATGDYTLNAGTLTANALNLRDHGSFTFNAGSLALSNLNFTGTVTGGYASLNNNAPTRLSSLSFAGTPASPIGQLNLNASSLILQATTANKASTLANLASSLLAGKNNGSAGPWTGPGITSSTVAANPTKLTVGLFDNADLNLSTYQGQPLDPNSLLVAPTQIGDANLDHQVDLADYDTWYKHVGAAGSATSKGDFNLDNQIDLADYDAWYAHVGASFPLSSYGIPNSLIPIPEPATFALPLLALFLRRTKRT